MKNIVRNRIKCELKFYPQNILSLEMLKILSFQRKENESIKFK